MGSSFTRIFSLVLLLLIGLVACNQENEDNSDLVQANAYLDVAKIYRNQGQFRAGIIEAQNALQAFPEHSEAQRFISQLFMEMGNNQTALEMLERLIDENPADTGLGLLRAEAYLNMGNTASVLSTLENLQALTDEQQVQLNWLEGNAYARNNNLIAAQEAFDLAINLDPLHMASLVNLSMLQFQAGNEFGAQEFLDRANEVDPRDLDLLIWQGQFALLREQYSESEAAFFGALQIMGNYDTMTSKRISVLRAIIVPLQMQQKDAEALRYLQIIADTPLGQLQDSFSNALAMFQAGNFEQAAESVSRVLEQVPDHAGSNILMGLSRYAQGNYRGAEESLAGLVNAETSSPEVIRILAATHLRLNQADRALSVLVEASTIFPEDGLLLAMMAISQQSLGNIDESIATFNRAIAVQPDSADIHFALAGSYFLNEEIDSSIGQLNRVLEINPNHDAAKLTLVDIYMSADNPDQATQLTNQWLAQDSQSVGNYNVAGRVAFRRGDLSGARDYFDATLGIDSANIEARLFLARINLDEGDYAAAESDFQQILDATPANLEALSGLLALGDLSQSAAAKVAEVNRIIEEQPAEFIPPLILAQYHFSKQEFENARAPAELAYERNVNVYTENTLLEIIIQLANLARQDQDLDEARELVVYALDLRADTIPVLMLAAGVESQAGAYSAALLYIDRIKDLQPEGSTLALELEGELAVRQGEVEQGLDIFQQAWAISRSSALGARIHGAFTVLEQTDAANQFLQEWLSVSPEDLSANLLQGMALQQDNQIEEAIAAYEIVYSQAPDSLIALNNLAWLYQDTNPPLALELANRAADLYPANADVLDTYGWILFNQNGNDTTIAIQVLERALELAPDSAAIAEHLATARQ